MSISTVSKTIKYEIKDISNSAEVLAALLQCMKEYGKKVGANTVKADIIDVLGIEQLIHDSISKRLDNEY